MSDPAKLTTFESVSRKRCPIPSRWQTTGGAEPNGEALVITYIFSRGERGWLIVLSLKPRRGNLFIATPP